MFFFLQLEVVFFFFIYKRSGLKPGQSNLELWKIRKKNFPTNTGPTGYILDVLINQSTLYLEWVRGFGWFSVKQTFTTPCHDSLLHRLCNAATVMKTLFMVYFCVKRTPSLVTPSPLCDNTCWTSVLQSKRAATNKTLINACFLNP